MRGEYNRDYALQSSHSGNLTAQGSNDEEKPEAVEEKYSWKKKAG